MSVRWIMVEGRRDGVKEMDKTTVEYPDENQKIKGAARGEKKGVLTKQGERTRREMRAEASATEATRESGIGSNETIKARTVTLLEREPF